MRHRITKRQGVSSYLVVGNLERTSKSGHYVGSDETLSLFFLSTFEEPFIRDIFISSWQETMIRPSRTFLSTRVQRRIISQRHNSSERVVVALSGGVDSSVALGLVQADPQNDSLSAIYMSNWNLYDDDSVQCTTEVDWKDAQAAARHFCCPIQRIALEAEYWTCVFEPFLDGLSSHKQMGNPDIACNSYIKFGALLENVQQRFGQDTVLATGHYARLWNPRRETTPPPFLQTVLETDSTGLVSWLTEKSIQSNSSILLAAADFTKDQSYFLSGCSGHALRDVRFPLGDLYKKKPGPTKDIQTVRQLASDWRVPVASKRDSTGICFVGKRRSFRDFLLQNQYLPDAQAPVDFVDVDTQTIVGTTAPENAHPVLFTPGQGARISGGPTKYFIVGVLKPADGFHHHQVGVCAGTHHPALYADALLMENINWVTGCPPPQLLNGQYLRLKCRIRHLQPLQNCTLSCKGIGRYRISFDLPLRGITSGQQAVFYDPSGLVCLGGGAISERGPSFFERGLPLPNEVAPAGHNDQSTAQRSCIQN